MLSMAKCENRMLQAPCSIALYDKDSRCDHWEIMEGDDETYNTISPTSSFENSANSNGSSSSSDLVDDASSSTSSSISNGPLYELSELMAQLPIKRGLSKYFQGKSQSFTSLARVRSIEDLAKKETPYRRKLKACKSYGGGLDAHKSYTLPKATISKKASRSSILSLSNLGRKSSFIGNCRPLAIPAQNNPQC